MTLREKVARAIAEAKTGLDPETRIVPFQPMSLGQGAVVMPHEDSIVPLWSHYLGCADAALKAIREEFEAAAILDGVREAREV